MSSLTLHFEIFAPGRCGQRRQAGRLRLRDVSPDMSFLEMLDVLNEELTRRNEDPIAFDYDCREGICGSCGVVINGVAHRPRQGHRPCRCSCATSATRDTIVVEPWRARAFPVVKDLGGGPSRVDRIIACGRSTADRHRQSHRTPTDIDGERPCRSCDGCRHLHRLRRLRRGLQERVLGIVRRRQGRPPAAAAAGAVERERRVARMVEQMEREGFGACSNEGECQAVCPKEISTDHIQILNREYARAVLKGY